MSDIGETVEETSEKTSENINESGGNTGKDKGKRKKHEIDMVNGPILKKMLVFALPLMLSSIMQMLFNATDIVILGQFVGDHSLAAVGSTSSLINLLTNLFIGLSVGANVLVGRYFGGRKMQQLNEAIHTAVTISFASGLMLAVIGFIAAEPILRLMQTPDNLVGLAALYIRVLFLGMPSMMLYNFGSAILRAKGDTKRPLFFLLAAGVTNVVLDLVFVIAFNMSVAGVAAATAIAQTLSAALVIRCLLREEEGFKLSLKKLGVNKEHFKSILRVGLPSGFQGVLFAISNVVVQASINSFGDVTMAGSAAASNIENFVYFGMNAFYQSAISFTSQNVGAFRYDRVKPIMIRSVSCAAVTGLVLGNLAYLFGHTLLGIYTGSPDVIEEGMKRLAIICTTYALCGMMDTMVGVMRGLGYSIVPMIVSLVGACGLRLLWLATIFQIEQFHTITVVYLSYPVTWFITLAAHCVCYVLIMKHIKKEIPNESLIGKRQSS